MSHNDFTSDNRTLTGIVKYEVFAIKQDIKCRIRTNYIDRKNQILFLRAVWSPDLDNATNHSQQSTKSQSSASFKTRVSQFAVPVLRPETVWQLDNDRIWRRKLTTPYTERPLPPRTEICHTIEQNGQIIGLCILITHDFQIKLLQFKIRIGVIFTIQNDKLIHIRICINIYCM